MHIIKWLVPVLCIAASCGDPVGTVTSGAPVTAGGATSMTPGSSITSAAGTMSLGGAPGAGTASVLPPDPSVSMAGGASSGSAGSPSAGAAGQMTVASAGAASGGGTAGTPTFGGSAGTFAGTAGAGGSASGAGGEGLGGAEAGAAGETGEAGAGSDLLALAAGFHELFLHDACTGVEPSQPDTCIHEQLVEESFTFGGSGPGTYSVTLRVRGLFEPTTISGGDAPLEEHPYFRVGGTVSAVDYSHWHIEVSDPPQTYWLNHYPSTSHTIYQEDFEATIEVAAGASVAVRVVDGNNRQIDNAEEGLEDRRQMIEGVTDEVLDGQMLRLDVIDVTPR